MHKQLIRQVAPFILAILALLSLPMRTSLAQEWNVLITTPLNWTQFTPGSEISCTAQCSVAIPVIPKCGIIALAALLLVIGIAFIRRGSPGFATSGLLFLIMAFLAPTTIQAKADSVSVCADNIVWSVEGTSFSGHGPAFSFIPSEPGTFRVVASLEETNTTIDLFVNSRSSWSTHSRVMWSTHVHMMWSTHFESTVFKKRELPMPGYGGQPCSDNVL